MNPHGHGNHLTFDRKSGTLFISAALGNGVAGEKNQIVFLKYNMKSLVRYFEIRCCKTL